MIKSKQGVQFYLIYSLQSCARFLHFCKQILQTAWTFTSSITLGKTQHQCTFTALMGKDKNGSWYLLGKCTTGLLRSCLSLFNRYSWKWTKSCTYTHPCSEVAELFPPLFFLLLCPFCLKKALSHANESPTHDREDKTFSYHKSSDLCLCQHGVMGALPRWNAVNPGPTEKRTISKSSGSCLLNTAHECYQRLGISMQKPYPVLYLSYS